MKQPWVSGKIEKHLFSILKQFPGLNIKQWKNGQNPRYVFLEEVPQGADPSPLPLSPRRQLEIILTSKMPPPPHWDRRAILPNHIYYILVNVKQRSCADVNSPYQRKWWINSVALYINHYSEGGAQTAQCTCTHGHSFIFITIPPLKVFLCSGGDTGRGGGPLTFAEDYIAEWAL